MRRPGIYSRHVVTHLGSGGGRNWRMPLLPSRPVPVLHYPIGSLSNSPVLTSLDSGSPVRISWPAFYLELLQRGRGFSSFRGKDEAKRFPESSSPLPQTRLPCPRWCVEEISILIGLHIPLRRNSPGDFTLRFCWLCWYSSPTLAYALSTNRVWTRRPRCNPQITCSYAHLKPVTSSNFFPS